MRIFGKSKEAPKPEVKTPITQAAIMEAQIPDCPVCGCGAPAIWDNPSSCCRQYVRAWDLSNMA
jgi:hypothetical protein